MHKLVLITFFYQTGNLTMEKAQINVTTNETSCTQSAFIWTVRIWYLVGPIVNSTSPTQDVSMLKSQSIRIPFLPFYRLELELELQLQPSIRPCFLGVDHQMVISSNTQAVGKLWMSKRCGPHLSEGQWMKGLKVNNNKEIRWWVPQRLGQDGPDQRLGYRASTWDTDMIFARIGIGLVGH